MNGGWAPGPMTAVRFYDAFGRVWADVLWAEAIRDTAHRLPMIGGNIEVYEREEA